MNDHAINAQSFHRQCPLCTGKVETLRTQTWYIPRLGERKIGFGACDECGLVLQSPSVKPAEMNHYYETTAVYTKNSNNYTPTEEKYLSVRRNISDIKNLAGRMPSSVFQVGCSDGYTLSQYRQHGADSVVGIDPSEMNQSIAFDQFDVKTIKSNIEDFNTNEKFELVLLTHVLEHLYEPQKVLEKCARFQNQGGWLLAEVPLLERKELFPTGYLSFEHINYFSEALFSGMIEQCGYDIELVSKVYRDYRYPAVTVIAKKGLGRDKTTAIKDTISKTVLQELISEERDAWASIERTISKHINENDTLYLWGAGIHTAQLLANTDITSRYHILNLIDNSETKWGLQLHGIECISPEKLDIHLCSNIVISTCASENEVYRDLSKRYGAKANLIRLYHD